jgi:hypothetical protein
MSQPHWARLRHCYVTADKHGRVPALLLEWLRTRTCGTQGSAAHHRVGLVDLGPQHHPRVGKPLCCHGRCDERKPRDDAQSAQSPRNCQRRSLTTVNGGRISAGQRRPSSVAGACRQRGDSCGSTTRAGSFVAPSCLRQVEPAELQHPLDHLVHLCRGENQVGQPVPRAWRRRLATGHGYLPRPPSASRTTRRRTLALSPWSKSDGYRVPVAIARFLSWRGRVR